MPGFLFVWRPGIFNPLQGNLEKDAQQAKNIVEKCRDCPYHIKDAIRTFNYRGVTLLAT
ncbi:hypothetical protein GCM10010913_10410 [Paenibacillus aceti]|uniref:Uncharacterized protein n=1 Tax=Paenibacillus aceti TaxID=1820010 RepID=A0ABQ1VRZ9_9BACL|nr:hypothetical protein GCM10010913_10410 [Paenibacillus aceti]